MELGHVRQTDAPRDIYESPQNLFVADFIGSCTFLAGKLDRVEGKGIVMQTPWGLEVHGHCPRAECKFAKGEEVFCAIRPEDFRVRPPSEPHNEIPSKVASVVFTGRYNDVRADIGGTHRVQAEVDASAVLKIGDALKLYVRYDDAIILPARDDPFADRVRQLLAGQGAAD
jgi:ABC-type Fe3+/spermidine/putrescine transport system ATPase subunit